MTLHPLLDRLFTSWAEAEVVWALLRMPEDPARPEGDLDILLEQRTAQAAERIARRLGFVPVPGRPHDLHLLQFHRETGRWLWLHCVTELAFGPYRAVRPGLENRWLADRRAAGAVRVLAPGDEFWITLLHALLDHGRLDPRAQRRLARTAGTADPESPLAAGLKDLLPGGSSPATLLASAHAGDWKVLHALAPELREAAARRGRPALPSRVLGGIARELAALRHIHRARGVSVALLGPDGAGKSTLAQGLQESFVLPVRQVYMGLTGGWLRHVDKLRVPGVVRVGRLLVIWGRYLQAQYHTHRGRLVVFDRYIFDAEVPPPYPLSRWGRWARWMDGRACPAPDLVLILDAPGSLMHERKGEYTPETLEDWRQRFLGLQHRLRNVEVLDTSQPPDAVRTEAIDRIWRRYAERWGRR
jgi:thymidylate kinase